MKHIYLFMLLLIVVSSNAQTRFAKAGAKWCTGAAYFMGSTSYDPFYAVDSTISNIPCSYIPGLGCAYVQNDTVYNIATDGEIEFLYDYGAQVGDRWLIRNLYYRMNSYDSLIPLRVDSLSSLIIADDTLRVIYTSGDELNGNDYTGYGLRTLLEGVGSTEFTFRPGPWGWYDSGIPWTGCYSDSSIGAIRTYDLQSIDSCSCKFTTGIKEAGESLVSISYDASQQIISIDLVKEEKARILLYNLNGQQVLEDEIGDTNYTVSTRALTVGVYFCTVAIEGYKPYTKKIVVL